MRPATDEGVLFSVAYVHHIHSLYVYILCATLVWFGCVVWQPLHINEFHALLIVNQFMTLKLKSGIGSVTHCFQMSVIYLLNNKTEARRKFLQMLKSPHYHVRGLFKSFFVQNGFICIISLPFLDGPIPEPSLVRPAGPNQMVSRMQGPGKWHLVTWFHQFPLYLCAVIGILM